jgi:hypothetical protein
VARIHARRRRTVVTRCAGAQHLVVIHRNDRCPDSRAVAILADVGRRRVQRTLAGRVLAVVAADTIAGDIRMIEIRRRPGDRRMAVVAVVTARYMPRVLAGRRRAVMATAAGADNLGMVDGKYRQPRIRRVTVLANIGCLDMVLRLARCVDTVMAVDAVARDIDVVKVCRQPARGGMAVLAVVATADVCRVFARGNHAIVT